MPVPPHRAAEISWWDRLPACLLGMTGNPAFRAGRPTKSFCIFAITFEDRYI